MKTTATNRKLRLLLTAIRNNTLIPKPEFQRRLIWTNKHKIALLQTVLEQYPFPEIYIASGEVNPLTGEGTEMLVDGQQRITTLYQYFIGSNELRLGKEVRPYAELSETEKISFLEYEVVIRDLGKMGIDEIKAVFQKINSTNYSLNAIEIFNARFDGEFKAVCEELAEDRFFDERRIFSSYEIKRMQDVRFMLVLVATVMSTYFNRDDDLESYLQKYNDEFDEKDRIKDEVEKVFRFIEKCEFDSKSRVWKKIDLFTLLVELHRVMFRDKIDLDAKQLSSRLSQFYNAVDSGGGTEKVITFVKTYHEASIAATNDRGSRIKRGEIINQVIKGLI